MRRAISQNFTVDGVVLKATVIESPTIDDVVTTEAQIMAYEVFSKAPMTGRRVDRSIRDSLVRFGVVR